VDPVTLGMAKADAKRNYSPRRDWPARVPLGPGSHQFDPMKSLYNMTATSFRKGHAAISRATSGTGVCNISLFGDSRNAGATASQPVQEFAPAGMLRSKLDRIAPGGTGVMFAFDRTVGTPAQTPGFLYADLRWVRSGTGWTDGAEGPFSKSVAIANGVDNFYDITVSDCDSFHILTHIAGAWTYQLDGGPVVSPVITANAGTAKQRTIVDAGYRGQHTIRVIAPAVGTIHLAGVEATIGSAGFRVSQVAYSSQQAYQLAFPSDATGIKTRESAFAFARPDIGIMDLLINSYQGQEPLAATLANNRVVLEKIKETGDPLLLTAFPRSNPSSYAIPLEAYNELYYQLADEYNVPLLDMQNRWGTYAEMNAAPFGYYGDVVHENDKGAADYTNAIFDALPLPATRAVPDTLSPARVEINPLDTPVRHVNWNNITVDPAAVGNALMGTSDGLVGNEISFDVVLGAGTWNIELMHATSTNRGIYSVFIDEIAVGTIDGYSAAVTRNVRSSIAGVAVKAAGKHRVTLRMLTKNATSTAFLGSIQRLVLKRS
jgi:hypothetical protein